MATQSPSLKILSFKNLNNYSKQAVEESPKELEDISFQMIPESVEMRDVGNQLNNNHKTNHNTSFKSQKNINIDQKMRKSKLQTTAFPQHSIGAVNILRQQRTIQKQMKFYLDDIYLRIKSKLTKTKFDFINDVTAYFDIFQRQQEISYNDHTIIKQSNTITPEKLSISRRNINILRQISEKYQQIPLFERDSKFLLLWNIFNALIKIFCIFWFTIHQFFLINQFECSDSHFYFILYMILLFLLLISLVINLNKIYIDSGIFIKDKLQIAQHYIKNDLLQDLLCISPVIMSLFDLSSCSKINAVNAVKEKPLVLDYRFFINLLILIMLKDFFDSIEEVFRQLKMQVKQKMIAELGKLIILIILIAHIFACSLKFISEFELTYLDYKQTWILHYDLIFQPWYIQYIYSFYWSTTIMITVGFGDFTAQTPLEACFIVLVMLIGCGIFGFAINKIGGIVNELNQSKINLQNDQDALTNYLTEKKLNSDIIQRSIAYLEYFHSVKHSTDEEKQIIKKLPPNLQEEISNQINQKVIGNFSILVNNFSKQTIDSLMRKVNEQITSPGQIIISPKDQEQSLYFLLEGQVDLVYYPVAIQNLIDVQNYKQNIEGFSNEPYKKRQTIIQLKENCVFGEKEFFTGLSLQFIAISKSYCKLYHIKRSDFVDIVRFNQDDLEKFFNIVDQQKQEKGLQKLTHCQSCQADCHNLEDCPSIHFKINKVRFIQREMLQTQKQKNRFMRNYRKKINSLVEQSNISYYAREIIQQYSSQNSIQGLSMHHIDEQEDESKNINEPKYQEENHILIEESAQKENHIQQDRKKKKKKTINAENPRQKSQTTIDETLNQPNSLKRLSKGFYQQLSEQHHTNKDSNLSALSNDRSFTQIQLDYMKDGTSSFQIDKIKEFTIYKVEANISNVIKLYQKQLKKLIYKRRISNKGNSSKVHKVNSLTHDWKSKKQLS